MKTIRGIAHFFVQNPNGELLIVRTIKQEIIDKLSGPTGKKEMHRRKNKNGQDLPDVQNHRWTRTDPDTGEVTSGGNNEKYVPLNRPIQALISDPDEVEEEAE